MRSGRGIAGFKIKEKSEHVRFNKFVQKYMLKDRLVVQQIFQNSK